MHVDTRKNYATVEIHPNGLRPLSDQILHDFSLSHATSLLFESLAQQGWHGTDISIVAREQAFGREGTGESLFAG